MRPLRPTVASALISSLLCLGLAVALTTGAPAAADSVVGQPVQYVDVSGATLGYRESGSGPPLVLITGSSSTMAEWDPRLVDALAVTHRVIVFDNRGAGTSTGDVSHLTVALMARDTAQLIAQVTAGSADVLGWSMGGYVAQQLAIAAPSRVRRLVLASTDCGGPDTVPPRPWALRILVDPDATREQRMSLLFPPGHQDAAAEWAAAIGRVYATAQYQPSDAFDVDPATVAAQARAAGPLWLGAKGGTCARLPQIRSRTLVAAGRRDVVVPVANHRALVEGLRHSTVRLYPDAGHAFLFQPDLGFAQAVSRFLLAPNP